MGRLLEYVFDLITAVILARTLVAAVRHLRGNPAGRFWGSRSSFAKQPTETVQGKMARDPVCGMFVSTDLSHQLKWRGDTLHFCSPECLERYRKNAGAA